MARDLRISVIVCAHNEARYLRACLHSVLAQSRQPDELLVINNASTDETAVVAAEIPFVHVIDERRKGLVVAREAGRRHASGDLIYRDADILRIGTIFNGGNFAVRREALDRRTGRQSEPHCAATSMSR